MNVHKTQKATTKIEVAQWQICGNKKNAGLWLCFDWGRKDPLVRRYTKTNEEQEMQRGYACLYANKFRSCAAPQTYNNFDESFTNTSFIIN
uniref:Uncharacterized protein n=1 Tax=Romanomermis culicivorax TaxID=13658 RepID=A0A915I5U4_ROMCU